MQREPGKTNAQRDREEGTSMQREPGKTNAQRERDGETSAERERDGETSAERERKGEAGAPPAWEKSAGMQSDAASISGLPARMGEGGARAARADGDSWLRCAREVRVVPATRSGALADGTPCERIDLADDATTLAATLDRIAPDLVINAAAYTAVDRAEDEERLAQKINGEAVGTLGEWAARHGARVVHYSTDYVFDGGADRPYREDDPPHPLSAYGRSKLAGEEALRARDARYLVFRTCWVYAPRGHNFLRTMLRLGGERGEVRVVDDQVGAPTPARLVADATLRALEGWYADAARASDAEPAAGRADATRALDGTYHVAAAGQTSWCGFARAIFDRAVGRGLLARAPRVVSIASVDFPTPARRPAYSVLDCAKARASFGMLLPDWRACLDDAMDEIPVGRAASP